MKIKSIHESGTRPRDWTFTFSNSDNPLQNPREICVREETLFDVEKFNAACETWLGTTCEDATSQAVWEGTLNQRGVYRSGTPKHQPARAMPPKGSVQLTKIELLATYEHSENDWRVTVTETCKNGKTISFVCGEDVLFGIDSFRRQCEWSTGKPLFFNAGGSEWINFLKTLAPSTGVATSGVATS